MKNSLVNEAMPFVNADYEVTKTKSKRINPSFFQEFDYY